MRRIRDARKRVITLATIGSIGASLFLAAGASAASIVVTSAADPAATSGDCTLRQAIDSANSNTTPLASNCTAGTATDTISFAQSILPAHITLNSGELAPSADMTITGPITNDPAQVIVDGNDVTRVFHIIGADPGGGTPGPTVAISALTVTGGHYFYPGPDPRGGAGIAVDFNSIVTVDHSAVTGNAAFADLNGGSNPASVSGAGILNNGTLNVNDTTIAGNQLTANMINGTTDTIAATFGAGITTLSGRELHVDRSTISGNTETATAPTGPNRNTQTSGGGIWVSSSAGPVSITSSTIANNTLSSGAAGSVSETGGGIYSDTSAVAVTSDTITGNDAATGANVMGDFGAPVTLTNTIVADPVTGVNCSSVTSGGYNWSDDTTCNPNGTSDVASANPHLLALGNYGGPTRTRPPDAPNGVLPTVIDQGFAASQPTDQRGLDRNVDYSIAEPTGGDGTDVGAVEIQGATPTATNPASPGDGADPLVLGTSEPGTTVSLFGGGACTLTALDTGTDGDFASPGLDPSASLPQNSTNDFSTSAAYGTATSECAAINYQRRPALPTLDSTDPPSGANNNIPKVIGTATPSSTVNIYTVAGCTGPVAATGSGAGFVGGFQVTVPDNSTTTFYAQATGVGGTSNCTPTGLSYTEVTPPPPTPTPTPTPPVTTPPATTKKKCKKGFKLKKVKGKKKCVRSKKK